jgi:O-antigen ligase
MSTWQRIFLGVIIFEIAFQIDTYSVFQDRWADVGAIGGYNLSLSTVCLGVLYASWLIRSAALAGYPSRRGLYVNFPLTLYVAIMGASTAIAQDRLLASYGVFLIIQAYLIYLYVSNHVQIRDDVTYIVALLAVVLSLQAAVMIGLRVLGHDVSIGPIVGRIESDTRVSGTIGSPVTAGCYLALLLAPTLSLLATPLSRPYKLLALTAFSLGGLALFLTLTRGAWIAFGISIGILCLLGWYRRLISAWMPLTFAFALVLVGIIFQESIANRIFEDEGSAHSRIPLIQMAWSMIGDNPVLGVGVNNCAFVASKYALSSDLRQEWFYTIHNKYLLEWVETGIFGLAAFLLFLLSTLRTGWHVWLRNDSLLSPIALGLSVAITGQMVHMLVDVFNSRPQVQMLWFCAGLIAALPRVEEAE